MRPEQLAARRRQLREGWKQSVDFAIQTRADVYIHGGDLFDGPNPRASELIWTAGQFQRLSDAGIHVLLIGGNHDIPKTRLGGATPQRLFSEMRHATVFTNPTRVEWWTAEIDGTRIAVGGLPPDPRLERHEDPIQELAEDITPPEADYRILLTHFAVEGRMHPLAEEATISKQSISDMAGKIDHILIGHLHDAKPFEVAGVKVLFPGPTERLSFGEMDLECGFAELIIAGRRPCQVEATIKHIDPQPMRRETIRASQIPEEESSEWLIERLRHMSAPDQIFQLRLEGPLARNVYHALRFREVWEVGQDLNFYFDLNRHLLTVADESIDLDFRGTERISARGEIARVADGMARAAETEEEEALMLDAKEMVLAQYGGGEMEG